MKVKQLILFSVTFTLFIILMTLSSQTIQAEENAKEKSETLYKYTQAMQEIPYYPANYSYINWRDQAQTFNNLLFDLNNQFMFYQQGGKNTGRQVLGIKTYTDDEMNVNSTQALTLMGALLSANKFQPENITQEEINSLVEYVESYYNIENGEGTLLNYQNKASSELSFWEQIYPSLTYFMLMDRYEPTIDSEAILKNIADTWYEVVMNLGGSEGLVDFGYTGYDFKNNQPFDNGEWIEPDAAAGIALLQYYAFEKFKDPKYMGATNLCMEYLEEFQRNPGYELLYLYLPYLSARLNSIEEYHYNTAKYMEFFFTESDYRHEYGMFNADYGTGLIGHRTDYGGTAESFPSIVGATALVPMLKYDQRYAIEVGRYLLHVTENLKLFYEEANIPLAQVSKMQNSQEEKKHSLLSGAYLGLLAAMIEPTNVEGILKVDINSNEYYVDDQEEQKPLFLLFNPYEEEKTIEYTVESSGKVSLYDLVSHQFIEQNVEKETNILIPAEEAVIVLEIPVEEGENQFHIDRKVEHSVTANVPVAANILGLHQYDVIKNDYPIELDILSTDDAAVTTIEIYIDGNSVFKNVNYTKPYVVNVEELVNGYHLLEVEVTTNTGVKDYSYARIFIQKEEEPYILDINSSNIHSWESDDSAISISDDKVVIDSRIISEPFEIDFSQMPLIDLQVDNFTQPWTLTLIDTQTHQEFKLFEESIEAGHIIASMGYKMNKLNPGATHLLGKHQVQLAITPSLSSSVTLSSIRVFNQGVQPIKVSDFKSSFTTQKITHWQSRFNALAKINYYEKSAHIKNLNPDGNGGMQTDYFEIDLKKNPKFMINVKDVDELWSLLVYVEGDDRGYYLQYPTDKVGTFTYDINQELEKVLSKEELESTKNLQFWIISNGDYGSEVQIEYLRLEYSKNWLQWIAIGGLVILSITGICVNLNKDS